MFQNPRHQRQVFRASCSATEAGCSIINEWLTMRGDLESEGDILVRGKVHGNVICRLLVMDTDAVVEGTTKPTKSSSAAPPVA
jgi:cytoskeletal protein CcmA (bactofilin family)